MHQTALTDFEPSGTDGDADATGADDADGLALSYADDAEWGVDPSPTQVTVADDGTVDASADQLRSVLGATPE
jgi:hypothetical protein